MPVVGLVFLIAFFLFPINTFATQVDVVLNEIYPPTSSQDWVEIYNRGPAEVNISGWKLRDTATTPMKIIPENTTINPGGFLVIEVGNRLNNTGDTVKLVDPEEIERDSFTYNGSTAGRSFARLPDGNIWQADQNPTKGTTNNTRAPDDGVSPPGAGRISLTEFMPNPNGGDEWAEVYNPQEYELNLSGWKIDDIEGASSPFLIPNGARIGAKEYKIFSFSGKLNNSGDTIRLLSPTGEVVESFTFKETIKGASFAKDLSGAWQLTFTPTPGATNKITPVGNQTRLPTIKPSSQARIYPSQTDFTDTLGSTKGTGENYTLASNPRGNEQIAGVSTKHFRDKNLSTLLIAAGFSFLVTAFVWPFVEKRLWRK